jgi:hypothetical protein
MEEVWRKISDKDMLKFWILSHPSNFAFLIVASVTFIALILPRIVARYAMFFKKKDFRPLMIIYNGFFFGAFGVGMPLLFATTRNCRDFFSCDAIPELRKDLTSIALKHLSVVFLKLMYVDMGFFVIQVIRMKRLSLSELMHQVLWMMVMYTTLTIQPLGFTIFACSMHMFTRIYKYGYLVLTVARIVPRSWRVSFTVIELIANLLTVVHHVYYLTIVSCGNPFTLTMTSAYCAIRACLLGLKVITTYKPSAVKWTKD